MRKGSKLEREGLFFDPNTVPEEQEPALVAYAGEKGLEVLTVIEFRRDILLKYGYRRHATVVGFNLPFDLSRIALNHGTARRDKRGGFSFLLTRDDPRIRVRHLNSKAAMIDFSKPGEQDRSRGMRNRGVEVKTYRGHFVDVKTVASALLSQNHSLHSLGEELQTATQKRDPGEHGQISESYLDYARDDVQVTWECYQKLSLRYQEHGLSRAISKILSEASIGKAYLQEMSIRPFLGCDPAFPRERIGEIMGAYFGGRAEVRLRRVICETLYCDFKSMYPTVNALMGLWTFVTAEGLVPEDTTRYTRTFLERVTLDDLQDPETWLQLRTIVQVRPDDDVFPVRAEYDERTYTIGLNHLTSPELVWYTLADCIVSKLLTGECPNIISAITYRPKPSQDGLKAVRILGEDDYLIDPDSDDLFTRLIDLRDEVRSKDESIQKTLKIIANSTSYGIFIEINRDDAPKSVPLNLFDFNSNCRELNSKVIEEPGRFFCPLLGVLITGAARLMLGIAEKLVLDAGLDWAFCDTDSIAMVRTESISRREFNKRSQDIIDWFEPLNPYKEPGSILQIEDVNFAVNSDELEPLYCLAISSKRYALFNLNAKGEPVLRKASAHGLGHLLEPYNEEHAPPELPRPRVPVHKLGVMRWQHDFWLKIIQAALDGHPNQVPLDWHPALSKPAASRYSASSPHLLRWFNTWNRGRPYEDQVRPFGFLLSFMPRNGLFATTPCPEESVVNAPRRGRPRKEEDYKPIAPYDGDPVRAAQQVFDRETGEPIDPSQLKTYAEALCQYHLSSEDKFENGQFLDRGRTERRHVVATGYVLIGKEANQVGESGETDPIVSAVNEFGRLD